MEMLLGYSEEQGKRHVTVPLTHERLGVGVKQMQGDKEPAGSHCSCADFLCWQGIK